MTLLSRMIARDRPGMCCSSRTRRAMRSISSCGWADVAPQLLRQGTSGAGDSGREVCASAVAGTNAMKEKSASAPNDARNGIEELAGPPPLPGWRGTGGVKGRMTADITDSSHPRRLIERQGRCRNGYAADTAGVYIHDDDAERAEICFGLELNALVEGEPIAHGVLVGGGLEMQADGLAGDVSALAGCIAFDEEYVELTGP